MRILLAILIAICCAAPAITEERRLALIIANEDYPTEIGRLTNTHEDAAIVEAALQRVGFHVTKMLDADADAMEEALTNFELAINREAADGDDVVAFFYGSMHGAAAEVDGRTRNFLLPAKETIASTGQLIRKGVRMDQMISGFASTNAKAVLVVSDACRNDLGISFSKSTAKGFIAERSQPGMLVAYATSPGATTPDDGLFASVLAEELVRPGRKASFAMLAAIEGVAQRRSFDGQPFLSSGGLPDWLCFADCERPAVADNNALAGDEELAFAKALTADTLEAFQAFKDRFPESNRLMYVEGRINALSYNVKILETSESSTDSDKDAQPIIRATPHFPVEAVQSLWEEGVGKWECHLVFDVDKTGIPFNIERRDCRDVFWTEAARAVQKWKFAPKIVNGEPQYRFGVENTVVFRLE